IWDSRRGSRAVSYRFITKTLPFRNVDKWKRDIHAKPRGGMEEFEMAAVQGNNGTYGGQAQAETRNIRCLRRNPVKPGAEFGQLRGGHARAVVAHGNVSGALFGPCLHVNTGAGAGVFEGI